MYLLRLLCIVAVPLEAVSYTHLRAHETVLDLVCRLLLEKKKKERTKKINKKKKNKKIFSNITAISKQPRVAIRSLDDTIQTT